MKRVLFVTNYPSPYRVSFFDILGRDADVTILFADRIEKKTHRNAQWFVQSNGSCHMVQLERRVASLKGRDLCLDVIDWLKKPWDRIILCGYSSPTVMLAMAWLRFKGIPFWMEVDGGLVRNERRIVYLAKKMLVSSASGWLSSGKATTRYLVHYGAKEELVREYPFSSLTEADISATAPTPEQKMELRRELGMQEKKIALYVGRVDPKKGVNDLLYALPKLAPDIGVYFVGGEPEQSQLDICRELGAENAHFVGFQKKDALSRYYIAADVLVLPTLSDVWGLVINEAMSFGLPVITTNRCVAGLELVEDGVNGYLIPPKDPDILAEKINLVLSGDAAKMGAASLEKIRLYTLENMARVHVKLFQDGIARN